MSFQTQVNGVLAAAVAGDFASQNPRYSVEAGPGGLVAHSDGLTVARFAWLTTPNDVEGEPTVARNTGSGVPIGIVPRVQNALITTYLAESGNVIPGGFAVGLMNAADMWVKNDGAGAAAVGNVAFAKTADGTISFAASGATVVGSVETKWVAISACAAGELIKISRLPGA